MVCYKMARAPYFGFRKCPLPPLLLPRVAPISSKGSTKGAGEEKKKKVVRSRGHLEP